MHYEALPDVNLEHLGNVERQAVSVTDEFHDEDFRALFISAGSDNAEADAEYNTSSSTGPLACLEIPFRTNLMKSFGEPVRKEATGQAMDSVAKGILHSSVVFFGPALIHLATTAAEESYCRATQKQTHHINDASDVSYIINDDVSHCDTSSADLRVYGLRPSSILTVASVAATLCTAIVLPFVGALIDRSRHRKTMGVITAGLIVAINIAQIFLTRTNWPLFWILHAVSDVLFLTHSVIVLAYLQNLTTNTAALSMYSSKFAILTFVCMILYMLTMIVYARTSGESIVTTSRLAHILSASIGAVTIGYSWLFLFQHRGPRVLVTPGANIFCESLAGLRHTLQQIRQHYPALKWMLCTILWSPDVGSGSYFSMLATIQKSLLHMNSAQIAAATLISLSFTVIGAQVSAICCTHKNALFSFRLNMILFFVSFGFTALFVTGPEHVHRYYLSSAMLGICFGWLVPTEKVLFCTLAPLGHEAELMGLIVCVHTAMAWLPPLLFSTINEWGWSLRWAMVSQNLLLATAFGFSLLMGDYDTAVAEARTPKPLTSQPDVTDV